MQCLGVGDASFTPDSGAIAGGIVISLLGGLVIVPGRFGLFRLPGDLEFGSKNWRVYFPIASCIILSIILTLILWLISYFRR